MKSRILAVVMCSLLVTAAAACSSSSGSADDTEPTSAPSAGTVEETISEKLQASLGLNATSSNCAAEILTETLPPETVESISNGEDLDLEGEAGDEAATLVREAIAQC